MSFPVTQERVMPTTPREEIAFPKLDSQQIGVLSSHAAARSFKKGARLFSEGEADYKFFVIRSGRVEILEESVARKKTVAVHEPGEFTGDVDMLTGRPAVVSGVALDDVDALELSSADLRRVMNESPALGERLLRAFLMRRTLLLEAGYQGVQVIGSRFSHDTFRLREFLTKNAVPFTFIDVETDANVAKFLENFHITAADMPVLTCGEQTILKNPSNRVVADCVGIRRPLNRDVYDLVIVGGGPAGLAAAVYGASEGLKTLILERAAPGGQASSSSRIENYMGFPNGLSGGDLAGRGLIQAQKFGAQISAADVRTLACGDGVKLVRLESDDEVRAKAVLIASGAAYERLPVPACGPLEGAGVYYGATLVEAQMCGGCPVVVVGAGNSAGQAAVFLSGHARRVTLCVRGGDLFKNMSSYLVERIQETPNIEVCLNTEVVNVEGDGRLSGVTLKNNLDGATRAQPADALFVFIGVKPHTGWVPEQIEMDENGFVKTGAAISPTRWPLGRPPYFLETSHPGVFAAGDVRHNSVKRVAAAVGEGSMAVMFVHQFLATS
jgi:thioredoxin reductase (NADPH)